MRALAMIAVLAGAGAARADVLDPGPDPVVPGSTGVSHTERRRNPLQDMGALVLRYIDAGRWETGAGVTGGWRPLLDVHARYYVADSVTIGLRLRLDLDGGAPRALELELGKAIGTGKMLFSDDFLVKTRLVVSWGTAMVRFDHGFTTFAFGGLSLRLQPRGTDWLSFELGVREALAPSLVTAAARATTSAPPRIEFGLVTELGASIALLWGRPRRECVWRGPIR